MRKWRKSSRAASQATRYQSGGRISRALWFDLSDGFYSLGVAVKEPQMQPLEKGCLEGGQQSRIDHAQVRDILLG